MPDVFITAFAASFLGCAAAVAFIGLGRYTLDFKRDRDVPAWVWAAMFLLFAFFALAVFASHEVIQRAVA